MFTKNLTHSLFNRLPYLDLNLDYWFGIHQDILFSISKCDSGLPYIDFFSVIAFKEKDIEIVDFYYSIKDRLTDENIPQKLLDQIFDEGFWSSKEKLNQIITDYPEAFMDHLKKDEIVDRLKSTMDYKWLKMENTIVDGVSLSRITIKYAEKSDETIDRILFSLGVLKSVYEELYNVDLSQFIDIEERRDNYNKLMTFLNIASDIVGSMPETLNLYSLYLHPIYHYNEVIVELGVIENSLRRRLILSALEPYKYEISIFENNKEKSTYAETIYKSIEILKNLLLGNDTGKN